MNISVTDLQWIWCIYGWHIKSWAFCKSCISTIVVQKSLALDCFFGLLQYFHAKYILQFALNAVNTATCCAINGWICPQLFIFKQSPIKACLLMLPQLDHFCAHLISTRIVLKLMTESDIWSPVGHRWKSPRLGGIPLQGRSSVIWGNLILCFWM